MSQMASSTDDIQLEIETVMDAAISAKVETTQLAQGSTQDNIHHNNDITDTDFFDEEEANIDSFSAQKSKTMRTHFSDAFTWLEPILYYFPPIWIRKETAKATPNYFALSLSIGFTLLYFALQYFYQITGWHLFSNIDNIIWCWYIIFLCLSRVLSVIYCWKYFNWPWKHESLPFYYQQQTESNNKKRVGRYQNLYVFLSIAYIVIDIIVVILETEALMPYYHFSILTYVLVKSLCRVFLLYPQLITTLVQSVIFVKYYLCLDQLYQNMKDTSTVDVQDIFEQYDKLYKSFKRDYHGTLRLSVASFLAAEVLFFWDSLNFMGMFVMFVIFVRELTIFWLFFHAASNLQKIHTRLSDEIWKNGHFLLEKKHNSGYYNYILQYTQKYPIYLMVGQVIVSTKNVIKFTFIIMVTRGISYALKHWVDENY